MRKRSLLLAPVVLVTTAIASLGSFVASQMTVVRRKARYPSRIVSVDGDQVTLKRDRGTERVGTYGLAFPGGHAVVGEVTGGTASTVVRPLVRVDAGILAPGPVALDHVDVGDPRVACSLDFTEVAVRSDVGEIPAWVVPADGDDWVVVVHGYGGRRASALSFLPMLHSLGLTAVVPAYRNDPDAPPSPDGRHHLGASEWRDVDAAIGYALHSGARNVVLFGWSMGGAIVLQAYSRSAHRERIAALVLDSPVVDWRSVLLHLGHRRHVPAPVVRLALTIVERRIGVDFDDLDWLRRSDELDVPVLVIHGDDDLTVPCAPSRSLAGLRPDLVELRIVAGAGHVGSWNVDPREYASSVESFLTGARSRVSV